MSNSINSINNIKNNDFIWFSMEDFTQANE